MTESAAAAAAIFFQPTPTTSGHQWWAPPAQIRLLSAFSNFFFKEEMKYGFAFRVGRWGKVAVYQLQQEWENSLARI